MTIIDITPCRVCDVKKLPTLDSRIERLSELTVDLLEEIGKEEPVRPNWCCPHHWLPLVDLRNRDFQPLTRKERRMVKLAKDAGKLLRFPGKGRPPFMM